MAFVFRADRKIHSDGKSAKEVGPGSYIGVHQYAPKPSLVPFASTSIRHVGPGEAQNSHTPGPGCYETKDGFLKKPQLKGSNSVSELFGTSYGGVFESLEAGGATKPSTAFASKVDRFGNQRKQKFLPGPGAYNVPSGMGKTSAKKNWLRQQAIARTTFHRMPDPPSIPSHNAIFGYEETEGRSGLPSDGDLLRQRNPDVVFSGEGEDKIGPGHYSVNPSMGGPNKRNIKGAQWHLSKSKRSMVESQALPEAVGPGSYDIKIQKDSPHKANKQSSIFASRVQRDMGLEGGMGKKSISHSRIQSKNLLKQQIEQEEEDEEDWEVYATPGPGYYNTNLTAFKKKKIPDRLQFFGSAASRFDQRQWVKQSHLAPGLYNVDASDFGKQPVSDGRAKAPFATSDRRFGQHVQDTEGVVKPGPGSYDVKSGSLEDQLRKLKGRPQGAFGTVQRRFVSAKDATVIGLQLQITPGPGSYQQGLGKSKSETGLRASSCFISRSQRDPYNIKDKQKSPAVGTYEVEAHTVKKKALEMKHQARLAQKGERFQAKITEEQRMLGPGSYDHQSFVALKKTVPISKQERFKEKSPIILKPGPGQYHGDDYNKWFKRSFNIIFAEY